MTTKSAPLFVSILALVFLRYNVVAGSDCYDLLDIVHIQDVSWPSHRFLSHLAPNVGSALTLMKDDFPGVHFGFASFSDKNISVKGLGNKGTLGGAAGYCLRVDQPLQSPDELRMANLFRELRTRPVKGEDSRSGVFEALYRAITAPSLRWRRKPLDGKTLGRYIVLVTSAPSRLGGDVSRVTGKDLRPFDITPFKIKRNGNDENYDCDKVEYPTIEQVARLVKSLKDTHIMIVVTPGGEFDSKGQFHLYESLGGELDTFQTYEGLLHWYTRQLKDAGLSAIPVLLLDKMPSYKNLIRSILNGASNKTACPKAASS